MKYNKHNLIYYSNLYKNILCFILFSQIILSCKQENIRNDSNSLSIITNADSLYYYYRPYFVVHIQDSADIEKYFLDQKNNIAKNELIISLHNIELENEFFKSFNRYDKITYLEFRYFKSNIDIIKLSQFTNLKYLSFYDIWHSNIQK